MTIPLATDIGPLLGRSKAVQSLELVLQFANAICETPKRCARAACCVRVWRMPSSTTRAYALRPWNGVAYWIRDVPMRMIGQVR
jgi:hypothetical protein